MCIPVLEELLCTAYADSDIRGGGRVCLLWFNDLIDIREFAENGLDFYVRMSSSELGMNLFFSYLT